MQFSVLGPLRVVAGDGDEPIVVSGGRLRVLLAVLLWRMNQPVPVDELAEMIWDGAPPAGAAAAARALVMRLRQVLGEQARTRIVTRAPGYMIRLSEDELDASRFEMLVRDIGGAVRAGRWMEAGHTAAVALGLWRGTPLVDVSSQLLRDQWVPHLEQARIQVLEWRIEADLHEGRHEQLIGELRDVIARHPLQEHFHAQLMLALARAGRQAEALAVYQEVRSALVSELGIEPGPELRQMQAGVLSGDVALVTPSSAAEEPQSPPSAVTIPRHLPATVRSFVGRRAELDVLYRLARLGEEVAGAGGAVVISAIDGMAGVGKTALAVHAAHRLAPSFSDGQLFIDMHGYTETSEPRSASEALDAFLRTLGVSPGRIPESAEERAALFRQCLADTRTLILLDNVVSEAQVRLLLPAAAGCLVLITSRRRLKGLDDAHVLALDVLPQADALALMRTVAGPERVAVDDPVLAEIVELCGRLPLALRIAAALLRHRPAWPMEHLARLLRDEWHRISTLSDGERDLGTVLDLSYRSLSGAQQRLFRSLRLVLGPDVDAYAAAALTGTGPADAARLLEELVDHNLLIQHVPGRYQLHDLIRLHAQTRARQDSARERDAALDRLLDYYLHTAGRADALVTRFPPRAPGGQAPAYAPALPDPDAAWAWLRAERANLLAALQHITTQDHDERIIALSSGLCTLLHVDGPWTRGIALHAAAAAAAQALGDQASRADALARLGYMRGMTGDFPGASRDLQHALELYREIADRHGQAETLNALGETRRVTGDLPGAAHDLQEALRLYREVDHRPGQAGALIQLGDMRRAAGDIPRADHDLRRALELYRELGNRMGEADVLLRRGDIRRTTGDFPGAVRDLRHALRLYRELGRWLGQANALARLGDIRQVTGDLQGAANDLQEALDLYLNLGHQLGQGNTLTFLGQVRLSAGDYPGAARHLEAAVDLFRRIGASGNQAWALNHYAAVIMAAGDLARAGTLYQDALRLAREAHHPDDEGRALEGIGECHLRSGDVEAGAAHLTQARDIYQRLAMKPDADRVRACLAQLLSL
jgi:DNA-binding SARP family transcriptional activator/tetratricopeptide (TPR) repeat protein